MYRTKSISIFLYLVSVFLLCNCNQENKPIINNPLNGKWINAYYVDNYIAFDNSGNAVTYYRGGERPGNWEVNMKNDRGIYEPFIFGPLKYKYSVNGDTIHYQYYGSLNDKIWRRCSAIRDSNVLHVWGYKNLPGIEKHIDEVGIYVLEGSDNTKKYTKKVVVIIDEGHEGALHIAFSQSSGDKPSYDLQGNPVLLVENGYIHKTTLKWDPRFMTKNAFDVQIRKCDTGELVNINDYGHSDYRNLASRMRSSDTVKIQDEDYSLSAFALGYNQYARDMIDYDFGEYIQGQVATFSIGYLEDQYVYKDYIKKLEKNSIAIRD